MKTEAGERYNAAMSAATTEMAMGVISSAAAGLALVSNPPILPGRAATSLLGDQNFASKPTTKKSDRVQSAIDEQEQAINRAGAKAADSAGATEATRDRRKSAMDNIKRFLDMMREMNPRI